MKITNLVIGGPEDTGGNPIPAFDKAGEIVNRKITITFEIVIGLHIGACERCRVKTPPPTVAQLMDLGVHYLHSTDGRYMAARYADDFASGNYLPATWGSVDRKLLCSACLPVVQAALRAALDFPVKKVEE